MKTKIRRIQLLVAHHFNLSIPQLLRKSRGEPLVTWRQMAMALSRELTGASYPVLRDAFQMDDHQTIRYGCITAEIKAGKDQELAETFVLLREKCRAALKLRRKP